MDKYHHTACKLPKTTKSSQCVVCLHINHAKSLPSSMNGQSIIVQCKKTKRSEGEKTLPVEVREGIALFDEVFLNYSSIGDASSVLKGIIVSVLVADKVDCCLGRFKIDSENLNCEINGGCLMSFDLEGIGNGGVLSVGVYCRFLEEEEEEGGNSCLNIQEKQNKTKCFTCFPDLKKLKIRQHALQPKRLTIKNSIKNQRHHPQEEDDEDFITMERGIARSRPRHPPSDDLESDDDHESIEQLEADGVEDEFLKMLEAKCLKETKGERKGYGAGGSLNYFSFDLDSLREEAEIELSRGELLEKEEYAELVKSWGSNYESTSHHAFGSPF